MADEPSTDKPKAEEQPKAGDDTPKTFTQTELDQKIGERLAREREKYANYDELKAKAEKLSEIEERDKSESEKLAGKVSSLTDDNKGLKGENLRLRVALDKQLPVDLIDRLRGDSQEDLEADADKLLELVKSRIDNENEPDFDGGPREPSPDPKKPEDAHTDFLANLLTGSSKT